MSPLQVAKAECANLGSEGNCAGIGIADDLSLYHFRQPGKCWLAPDDQGKIKRCQYFEQCVTPLAQARLRSAVAIDQRRDATRLAEGVRRYETAVMPVPAAKYAKCKRCQRQVHPPKRLCEQCAKNNTLKAKRQWWSKTRKNGASEALTTKDL